MAKGVGWGVGGSKPGKHRSRGLSSSQNCTVDSQVEVHLISEKLNMFHIKHPVLKFWEVSTLGLHNNPTPLADQSELHSLLETD